MNPNVALVAAVLLSPFVAAVTFIIQLVYAFYYAIEVFWTMPTEWYAEALAEQQEKEEGRE